MKSKDRGVINSPAEQCENEDISLQEISVLTPDSRDQARNSAQVKEEWKEELEKLKRKNEENLPTNPGEE
jgi:hypothetical protein